MPQEDPREPDRAWFDLEQVGTMLSERGGPWLEFLRRPTLRVGMYRLRVGEEDRQEPHEEDEIYFVLKGRARLRAGDQTRPVAQGAVAYVAARVPHRFIDIEEDLEVLVFFAARRAP